MQRFWIWFFGILTLLFLGAGSLMVSDRKERVMLPAWTYDDPWATIIIVFGFVVSLIVWTMLLTRSISPMPMEEPRVSKRH